MEVYHKGFCSGGYSEIFHSVAHFAREHRLALASDPVQKPANDFNFQTKIIQSL